MRDRLIAVLKEATAEAGNHFLENTKKVLAENGRFNSKEDTDRRNIYEVIADHLLANGVIVPKVKVGQTIYRCDFISHKVIDWSVARIDIYEEEIVYCDDCFNVFTEEEIGVREGVFLTREEAEQALRKEDEGK